MLHLIEGHHRSVMNLGQTGPWFPPCPPLPSNQYPHTCLHYSNLQLIIKCLSVMTGVLVTHMDGLGERGNYRTVTH